MDELLSAAFGFPVLLFSVAVVAAVGFWLLVLCGVVERGAFDSDVDTQSLRLGRVPVSVAASVFLLAGWLLSLTGALLRDLADLSRSSASLLSLALMVLAPAAAWWVTRRLVRPLAKLSPDEPGPSRRSAASLP
ncbi:hypothetical protein AB0B13_01750 [Streptomyces sp. NPDC042898]|uniref:hypothetical protein n=1 Tax=Streptomyces sp. NPDC042898 TaxID=3154334 RepID=UPI0033C3FB70